MYKSVDASVMRQFNKQTVLSLLYQQEQTSRVDISEQTGLNRATVSSLVDELIDEQFVEEVGFGASSGGRKPILLRFNARAGYTIGIDVQISYITTVVTDAVRRVVYENRCQLDARTHSLTADRLFDVLKKEIGLAIEMCPPSPRGLFGIGIGLPGLVNYATGHVSYLPNLNITEWPIVEQLSEIYPQTIVIDNDANCGAWAIYLSHRIKNLLFINAGIGVGSGIVLNGRVYRGRDGIAGEAGHTTISTIGVLCSCGNYGCWEQYSSEQALARYLREQGVDPADEFSPLFVSHCVHHAQRDVEAYSNSLRSLGQSLGIGISNLLQIFNPEAIFLGGTIAEAESIILPEIQRVIRHRAISKNKDMPIKIAPHPTVAVGAAGLALAQAIDIFPATTEKEH
ncbi:MAG: ROK family protein [Firmicutes bacterium]|nr:ROK family protein [Bacillota bacterium]